MKPILIKANGEERIVIPHNGTNFDLYELQGFVGGTIDIVPTRDGRIIVINDEGKINELPINEKATKLLHEKYTRIPGIYDEWNTIMGDVLVCDNSFVK